MRHDHLVDGTEGRAYDARLMRRLLVYLVPYRWPALAAIALLLLLVPLELVGPWLVKTAIDDHIRPGDPRGLGMVAAAYLAALVAVLLVKWLQGYLTQRVGQRGMMDLRMDVFRHIQRLPQSHFDRTPVGTLMTRVGSDVEVLNELLSTGIITVAGDVAILAGIVGVMLALNWRLALVTFTVTPLLLLATVLFRGRVRRTFRVIRQKVGAMNGHLQETITGIAVLQLFGQERANRQRFATLNGEYQEAYLRAIFLYAVFYPIVEVIGALAAALIILYGGGRILAGAMTLGSLVAFLEYAQRFMSPIQDLAEKYNILQSAMAAAERIFGVLDTPVQEEAVLPVLPLPAGPGGAIRFEHITFAYGDGEEVLRDVSFQVFPGERVAIVGATGAGKSSIISLLTRLYEPTAGRVLLDDVDIGHVPLHELRRRVGIVPQDLFLFAGTVTENVFMGPGDAGRARDILAELGALELFERLPEGLATPLRERASLLSTGQKQLLAFARALAYDSPVLVLDEATSSLDPETEGRVQSALARLLAGRTSIVIAHRLATIRDADRIIVMHHGRIRETGTHRELLALRKIYWRLHRLQFGGLAANED